MAIATEWCVALQRMKCIMLAPSGRVSESEIEKSRWSMYHCADCSRFAELNTTCESFAGIGSRSRILRASRVW